MNRLSRYENTSPSPLTVFMHGVRRPQDVQSIHAAARSAFQPSPADDDPELLDIIRSRLSAKIRCCCDYARAKGVPYAWIDACCIDKTSSAELSEAINSMYDWYSHAEVCYVFFADVSDAESPHAPDSRFRRSMWFTRGWTLQELIVPWGTVFLSKEWRMIGTKASLAGVIEAVTGIERDVLLHVRPLHTVSVARRMSWASLRRTTRVEDEAYCLMGIFGVRLPVIYGEGTQAFIRLQEEIMRRIPDQSLFSWGLMLPLDTRTPDKPLPGLRRVPVDELRASKGAYLLASCPGDFQHSARFSPIPLDVLFAQLELPSSAPTVCFPTSHGIQITLPVFTMQFAGKGSPVEMQLAMLACEDSAGRLPALFVSAMEGSWTHFTSGYDGENGFSVSHDGIVELLGSAGRLRRERDFERVQRSVWIRAARAAAFPHSKQYPRIALLDPSALAMCLVSTTPSVSVRSLCVPFQRLQAESGLAIYGRRPAWMGKGFTGDCEIFLPNWTLQHFRALGVTLDGGLEISNPDGILPMVARFVPWIRHHTFRLFHDATQSTVSITMFTCPVGFRGPLHVSVQWVGRSHASAEVWPSARSYSSTLR